MTNVLGDSLPMSCSGVYYGEMAKLMNIFDVEYLCKPWFKFLLHVYPLNHLGRMLTQMRV